MKKLTVLVVAAGLIVTAAAFTLTSGADVKSQVLVPDIVQGKENTNRILVPDIVLGNKVGNVLVPDIV